MTELSCRDLFERLSEYLDGELAGPLCDALESHLRDCPACERFCATLRRTIDFCRQLPVVPLPDDVRRELWTMLNRLPEG